MTFIPEFGSPEQTDGHDDNPKKYPESFSMFVPRDANLYDEYGSLIDDADQRAMELQRQADIKDIRAGLPAKLLAETREYYAKHPHRVDSVVVGGDPMYYGFTGFIPMTLSPAVRRKPVLIKKKDMDRELEGFMAGLSRSARGVYSIQFNDKTFTGAWQKVWQQYISEFRKSKQ